MHYSNDATDRSIRKRHFYLGVYALPLAAGLAVAALAYFAYQSGKLSGNDAYFGYFAAAGLYSFLHALQKKKWLKMPDGEYHHVAHLPQRTEINLQEPAEYLAEYGFSRKSKVFYLGFGVFLIGFNVLFVLKQQTGLFTIVSFIAGLVMVVVGIKGLLDKTPKLKIAATGIWTARLGFVHWDDLHFAEVVEEKSGDSPQLLLKIWKIGTPFDAANQPDEVLPLSGLEAHDDIEYRINNSIRAYNAGKTS